MVGGALQHLRSLRRLEDDGGLIRKLLDEAENERMHLMTFVQIARPRITSYNVCYTKLLRFGIVQLGKPVGGALV